MKTIMNESDGWEQLEKGSYLYHSLKSGTASIKKMSINLSADLRDKFEGFYGAEVLMNKQKKQLGIKPNKNKTEAFKMKNGMMAISSLYKSVSEQGIFKANWDEEQGMVIIHLLLPMAEGYSNNK